ncbi:MAG: type II 3-dehydroquinate dehydratase [Clostridiales bacterium]|jgi:3-dehydroquinate dehydratase type II|nr:type II 3-dehydroquinate dehydratase [Clostridiales bacterium]
MKILIINGANLDMLGTREPDVYGTNTLDDLELKIRTYAENREVEVEFFQSNLEGEIIEKIHSAPNEGFNGIVINPAAYTHYSIAIADSLACCPIPAVEVHISNIHGREHYRHKSVTAKNCVGQISGFGFESYNLAINALIKNNMIKKPDEIAKIRAAAEIGNKGYEYIKSIVKPGISELDIAKKLEEFMLSQGASGLSFDTIVACGSNSANPHAQPSRDRIVADNDMVMIDFGCVYQGYCSDMTRMIKVGELNDTQRKIWDIVLNAQQLAIKAIRPGVRAKDIDKIARDYIAEAGYGEQFIHTTGHGVGTVVHEEPRVSKVSDDILQSGMVITVEPGIYIKGEGGARIEDLILVTDDGYEVLSSGSREY